MKKRKVERFTMEGSREFFLRLTEKQEGLCDFDECVSKINRVIRDGLNRYGVFLLSDLAVCCVPRITGTRDEIQDRLYALLGRKRDIVVVSLVDTIQEYGVKRPFWCWERSYEVGDFIVYKKGIDDSVVKKFIRRYGWMEEFDWPTARRNLAVGKSRCY